MKRTEFDKYKSLHPSLEGWFLWEAAELLNYLNDIHIKENITGHIFEIGAYKGKLTLLLATFLRKDSELLLVNDIFDNQQLNISRSGVDANLNDFVKNIKLLFENPYFLRLFIKSSSELTIEDTTNNIRMFSVDGGHSEKETYDDIVLASRAIHEKGMIIVDDYYNADWPGVEKGIQKYFSNYQNIAPLLYFFNKFIFVSNISYIYYNNVLIDHQLFKFCEQHNFNINKQKLYGLDYYSVSQK